MRFSTAKGRGFTLIELLVVIAIMAVLISIVLPAFSAARSEASKSKCLSNIRGLLSLANAYANDDVKGVFGPVHVNARCFTAEGYSDYGGGPGTSPFLGWDQPFDPATRPFNQLMYGSEGMTNSSEPGNRGVFQEFLCPGEDFGYQEWPGWSDPAGEVEQPFFKSNGTSYRMNNLIWRTGFSLYVGGIYSRPINRIPDPAQVLAFMEARAIQTVWTNDAWGQLGIHGELTSYHKRLGWFNLGYSDGHAAFADMGNGTYYPQTRPKNTFDVRGTWGRMDCYPDKVLPDPYELVPPKPCP